jgi:hypothetical protein
VVFMAGAPDVAVPVERAPEVVFTSWGVAVVGGGTLVVAAVR